MSNFWEAMEADLADIDVAKIISEETSDTRVSEVHAEIHESLALLGDGTPDEARWLSATISHGSQEQYEALMTEGFLLARKRRDKMAAGRADGTLSSDALRTGVTVLNAIGLRLSMEKLLHECWDDDEATAEVLATATETMLMMAMGIIGFVWGFREDEDGIDATCMIHDFTNGKDYRWAF